MSERRQRRYRRLDRAASPAVERGLDKEPVDPRGGARPGALRDSRAWSPCGGAGTSRGWRACTGGAGEPWCSVPGAWLPRGRVVSRLDPFRVNRAILAAVPDKRMAGRLIVGEIRLECLGGGTIRRQRLGAAPSRQRGADEGVRAVPGWTGCGYGLLGEGSLRPHQLYVDDGSRVFERVLFRL